jgi:hypothetical protein
MDQTVFGENAPVFHKSRRDDPRIAQCFNTGYVGGISKSRKGRLRCYPAVSRPCGTGRPPNVTPALKRPGYSRGIPMGLKYKKLVPRHMSHPTHHTSFVNCWLARRIRTSKLCVGRRCGEMADAQDLKSWDRKKSCRFESDHRHHLLPIINLRRNSVNRHRLNGKCIDEKTKPVGMKDSIDLFRTATASSQDIGEIMKIGISVQISRRLFGAETAVEIGAQGAMRRVAGELTDMVDVIRRRREAHQLRIRFAAFPSGI